jgi:hypothetical protein
MLFFGKGTLSKAHKDDIAQNPIITAKILFTKSSLTNAETNA